MYSRLVSAGGRLVPLTAGTARVLRRSVCSTPTLSRSWMTTCDSFEHRHNGPSAADMKVMLEVVGASSLRDLVKKTVPADILMAEDAEHTLQPALTESEVMGRLKELAGKNKLWRSYIGTGYYNAILPPVIQRCMLENPGWYTPYTPYQPELAQGRLEALINYQTVVQDLTALPIANASLLDEATAAAEAFSVCFSTKAGKKVLKRPNFFVDAKCHPQVIEVVKTRGAPLGANIIVAEREDFVLDNKMCGVLYQYPDTEGSVYDMKAQIEEVHAAGGLAAACADPLALTMLTPPGELGCDVAVGSMQRFGIPLGYGGPHAAYIACREELKRRLPGRLVGVSVDAKGRTVYRLSLQTRETHIRRERATSNICTAQALLANMSGMYAVYHGPEGLRDIAGRVHQLAVCLAEFIESQGHELASQAFFDTLTVKPAPGVAQGNLVAAAAELKINLRVFDDGRVGVSVDETVTSSDLRDLMAIFRIGGPHLLSDDEFAAATADVPSSRLGDFERTSDFLQHPTFHRHRSETQLMRYCKQLENRDMSLVHSMTPLGSCTMKLNSAVQMLPLSWPELSALHPYCPPDQAEGYLEIFEEIRQDLCTLSGYDEVSLQPTSGASGEYAGLRAIREYQSSVGEGHRDVCLIPASAHGTNPASAAMCGMRTVGVKVTSKGAVDVADVAKKCEEHADTLSCIMITYPSTYGVFDDDVRQLCGVVHKFGGQVYLDGANMNAQMMLCQPGQYGADVSHFNLHKTFCIPHGGGGPGMGPIGVKSHLVPFLPGHSRVPGLGAGPQVSASAFGSSLITPISWSYIRSMGAEGLRASASLSILNANYMAARLSKGFVVAFAGTNGYCAHEFIIDCKPFEHVHINCTDVAKRLHDYGFHSPTMAWPLENSLMIEPTESEGLEEMDRFVDALLSIREEIREVEEGVYPQDDNVLVNAPHDQLTVLSDVWERPYSRHKAAFPAAYLAEAKQWPGCSRVDEAHGDKNLICSCPVIELE